MQDRELFRNSGVLLPASPFRKTEIELRKLAVQFPFMGFRCKFANQLFNFFGIFLYTVTDKEKAG